MPQTPRLLVSGELSLEPLEAALRHALLNVTRPIYVVEHPPGLALSQSGTQSWAGDPRRRATGCLRAYVPPLHPKDSVIPLSRPTAACAMRMSPRNGQRYHLGAHGHGDGQGRDAGFFRRRGLMPQEVEAAVDRLQREDPESPLGSI